MHHAPSGPPLSARLLSALYRALRPRHGRRVLVRPRFLSVLLGAVVIALLAVAVPAVPTTEGSPSSTAFDDSSSATGTTAIGGAARTGRAQRTDVVVMGVDGEAPAAGTTPTASGPTADATPAPRPDTVAPAPSAAATAPAAGTIGTTSAGSTAAGATSTPTPTPASSSTAASSTGSRSPATTSPTPTVDPVPTAPTISGDPLPPSSTAPSLAPATTTAATAAPRPAEHSR